MDQGARAESHGDRGAAWGPGRAALVSAVASLATLVPYVVLWLRAPPGSCYLWLKAVNSDDILTYVAWMEEARRGSGPWMQNLFTAESHGPDYFIPFFWALGLVGRLLGIPAMVVFHGSRVVGAFVLFMTVWWFVGTFVGGWSRVRAFLLLALGTGLPGLVPEASPFSAAHDATLMAVSWALVLVAFGTWRLGLLHGRARHLVACGATGALLAVIHPYDVVPLVVVMTLTAVAPIAPATLAVRILRLAVAGAVISVGVAFTAWIVFSSPLLRAWAETPRPMQWWALLSFGALWIGAGAAVAKRRADPFLLIWVVAGIVLCFVPSPIARRLIQGIQAPLALLATAGFEAWIAGGREKLARLTEVTFYPAAVMTLLLDPVILPLLIPALPYHVNCDLLADVRELESLPPGLMLTPPGVGYLVPALAVRQVWAGNYGLTIRWNDKVHDYGLLVEGKRDAHWLRESGIRFVVTPGGGLDGRPGLERLRALRRLVVYEVAAAPGSP